jgi:xanthine/uracil permease
MATDPDAKPEAVADQPRPEDEKVPAGTAFFYGLQHILAMYAGVVSPPIIIGSAAGLSPAEQALLVTAALFVSGLGRCCSRWACRGWARGSRWCRACPSPPSAR